MVSIKSLFLAVAAVVAVNAQENAPTGDSQAAQAYWESGLAASNPGASTSPARRGVLAERGATVDPYAPFYCTAPFKKPASLTKCSRNNCFRSFLNARQGSEGKHCPLNAFAVCCVWNNAPVAFFKYFAVSSGLVYQFVPYTKNCKSDGDDTWDIVAKIDDVCGCTLNHEVKVEPSSDYLTVSC